MLNPKTIQESFYDLENFKIARHAPSAGTNRLVNGNNKGEIRTRKHNDTVLTQHYQTLRCKGPKSGTVSHCAHPTA